jgi:hypothetical protein
MLDEKTKQDVVINDSTSPLFRYILIDEKKTDIALTSDISLNDTVINVSAGHGFTAAAGEIIVVWENNRFIQQEVVSVATNAITVSTPVTASYTVAGAIVFRGNNKMNIDGSSATGTPTDFKMTLTDFTVPIDISKIILTMTHSATGDDGKFGGIAALTNGVYFRKENSIVYSLGNYQNNQDFKDTGGSVTYTQKGSGGTEATDIVFNVKEIFGQVLRFDARADDILIGHVRDKIDTLTKFTVSIIGSYTSGE